MAQNIHDQIAELEAKIVELREQEAAQLVEKAKSFADAFLKKLEKEGISARDGLKAYCDLAKLPTPASLSAGGKKTRAARGTAVPKEKKYSVGVTYKDPKSDSSWVGNGKRPPKWLADLVAAGNESSKYALKGGAGGGDMVNNG